MIYLLTGFVHELRQAGIPVSMAEAIDASNALAVTDLSDRTGLQAVLGATLVKNSRHHQAFETVFEVYFGLRAPAPQGPGVVAGGNGGGEGAGGDGGGEGAAAQLEVELIGALVAALRDDNDALLRAVARQAVLRLSGFEPGRPAGGTYYTYRTLRRLEIDELADRVLGQLDAGTSPLQARWLREEVERRIDEFRSLVRSEVRRRLVEDRGAEAVARTLRRPVIEDIDLMQATREQLAEIERVIHPLTRKLAARLARRRRHERRGRLDVRSTVRRSLSTGGVPVQPRFRARRPSRPEIFLLCDISGSVATFARFTMQLVHAMSNHFARVRSFAFIDAIDEVSRFFRPGAEFAAAMDRIGAEAEVVWLDGHSDYGNSMAQFVERHLDDLTPRSVVLVTGDARNNYRDPNSDALAEIASAARALYWLNPERRRYWDTGDSVLSTYSPFCDGVFEVRNLRQLQRFVELVSLPTQRLYPATGNSQVSTVPGR